MTSIKKMLALQRPLSCLNQSMVQGARAMSAYPNMRRFENKTAVVTGSTAGIGLAIARRLASEGAHVVISSRKQENVDRALAELHKEGLKNVSGTVCDVVSSKDRSALFKFVADKRPGIDILVSNAGQRHLKNALTITEEEYDYMMDINLKSHFLIAQQAYPLIEKQGKGAVVFISSLGGYVPHPKNGAYSIAKIGVLQVMRLMAFQMAAANIRVNCVAPGIIETELSAPTVNDKEEMEHAFYRLMLKRIGKPEEVAGTVGFLCSDDASYITGETIIVAGGLQGRI